ncbi:type III secretion system translocator chaperone SicA [Pandoraea sp. PE-S2T-3]|uniref:type III secretion system translocator chaperone SicA n=1 Tax=Pandoraea sp. PE-S2T-3 TaxID=1986993 RepID=UPI0026E26074|nr:type III secretion system translocator chaperone SicA [Pandoraea sp. PE-S2T-3]
MGRHGDEMQDTLHAIAGAAMTRLMQVARDDGITLPTGFIRSLDVRGASSPYGVIASSTLVRRQTVLALRVSARHTEAGHVRTREAFAASQQVAMAADYAVAETQVVLDVLSPGDPQYTRAIHKSQHATAEARAASARADDCYRAVRAGSADGWVRCLASLPLPRMVMRSDRRESAGVAAVKDARGVIAHPMATQGKTGRATRVANWRGAGALPNGFLPTGRLAGRRLTRCRVSEGGKVMSNETKQFETEAVRATGAIWDAVIAGASLKDIHGISSETMDGLYAHAYDFYCKGQLAQAEAFFRFLCIYDFYNSEYIVGLAAVCQLKAEYQKAVDLYAMAFAVGKNDYRPVFYAGQCQMMMQDPVAARECFALVSESSADAELCARAVAYLSALDSPAPQESEDTNGAQSLQNGQDVKDKRASAKEAA